MRFKITHHSGFGAPAEALELLWPRLAASGAEVSFAKVGREIRAMTDEDAPVSVTSDERLEVGRLAVLSAVRDACDGVPGLKSDWFAVSPEH